MTDPISDMLTRIRNALTVGKQSVVMPYSKFKHNFARLLVSEGWLEEVFVREQHGKKLLGVGLKYANDNQPLIRQLQRVSKPGRRVYTGANNAPRAQSGLGITVISTSKGLMTDKQARKENVGGEVVAQIW